MHISEGVLSWQVLAASGGKVKLAILMQISGRDAETAQAHLESARGVLRDALAAGEP